MRVDVVVPAVHLTGVLVAQVAVEAAVVASTNGTYMIHSTIARPGTYQLRVGRLPVRIGMHRDIVMSQAWQ